jgi:RNA polymerase sigma-70 factor (ECF subfamily)
MHAVNAVNPAITPPLEFSSLYDDTVEVAWRVLARLGVYSGDLEDAVQDTFVIVHRRLAEFRWESKPSTWVTGIAVRVAHDYRRRRARKPTEPLEPHWVRLEDPHQRPDDAVSRNQAAEMLMRLLAQMETTQREVFVLVELEQQSAPDIAQIIGVPLNTVYSRLRLARAHLNQLVDALQRGNG